MQGGVSSETIFGRGGIYDVVLPPQFDFFEGLWYTLFVNTDRNVPYPFRKDVKRMNEPTLLARHIDAAKEKVKYDSQVKTILANKAILAWILKTCTEEFADYSPAEIISCIEGNPEISRRAVHAVDLDAAENEEMLSSDTDIEGSNTEDNNG